MLKTTLMKSLSLLIACSIPSFHIYGKMEDTGRVAPPSYYYFDLPPEAIPFVAKFLPDNPVIVEAGAYDGMESCKLAQYWRNGLVYCFEPVSQLFQKVLRNTQRYPNIQAFRMALGDSCGDKIIYLSTEEQDLNSVSMSSSLYPPKEHLMYSGTLFRGGEVVETITLDRWAEINGIEKVDMLWLDMQGFELPALKAAPKVLSKVSVIITELEFIEAYEGQPLYHEVKGWLEEQGFVLVGGNFTFPKSNNQWFGDGVFVRKELIGR